MYYVRLEKKSSFIRPHMPFRHPRPHIGVATPRGFLPECDRVSQQKTLYYLGCCEYNGVRFKLIGATVDLPCQVKLKMFSFSEICFFFVNNFLTTQDRAIFFDTFVFVSSEQVVGYTYNMTLQGQGHVVT